MKTSSHLDRRQFVKLGTLAVSAALLPSAAHAESAITLPALPYKFDALEPHIDALTMEIHHDKHHAAYIKNLNAALATAPDLAKQPLDKLLADLPAVPDEALRATLRNNGGGHANHTFFWKVIAPGGAKAPSGDLAAAIDNAFGSFDAFKEAFAKAATTRFGSGWAWLCKKEDGSLAVCSTANQDCPCMGAAIAGYDGKPILGLDVWEHAYYLNYQNRRPDYIAAFWSLVNWDAVAANYAG